MTPPFHLAFPVHDLAAARGFYVGVLGCREGRSAESWVDFDLRGHQLSAHLVEGGLSTTETIVAEINAVDGDDVPVRHFGLVLDRPAWDALAARVRDAGVPFLIDPRIRFADEVAEQGTFFVRDPSGNALEFKTFADPDRLFAT